MCAQKMRPLTTLSAMFNADDWFNVPVSTLSRMGIIGGYPSGDFQPNAPISRAEFCSRRHAIFREHRHCL